MSTAMHRYMESTVAECDLDDAVVEAFGGLDALAFQHWYFDWYDASVELLECPVGFAPTADALARLRIAGIERAYVNYLDETAKLWSTDPAIICLGAATHRKKTDGTGRAESLRRDKAVIAALRAEIEELRKAARETKP